MFCSYVSDPDYGWDRVTERELQDFFDHADDQVALIAASGRAWCAAKTPRY
jgi:hypothetical protein